MNNKERTPHKKKKKTTKQNKTIQTTNKQTKGMNSGAHEG
jgi:hypothetical protein